MSNLQLAGVTSTTRFSHALFALRKQANNRKLDTPKWALSPLTDAKYAVPRQTACKGNPRCILVHHIPVRIGRHPCTAISIEAPPTIDHFFGQLRKRVHQRMGYTCIHHMADSSFEAFAFNDRLCCSLCVMDDDKQ